MHSLQLFDDRFEVLDLTVAVVDGGNNVAHQTSQKLWISRQIVEICAVCPMVLEHADSKKNLDSNPRGFLRISQHLLAFRRALERAN
jgi:hypothetical protein